MFQNYLKTALRNIVRQKSHSIITISGLAIGIACCLLIFLYVTDELSYDGFHSKSDRLYRLTTNLNMSGKERKLAVTSAPMANIFKASIPEVVNSTRFSPDDDKVIITLGSDRYFEDKFFYADSSLFDLFDFPLVQGNPQTALSAPFSVLITESTAEKYFPDQDPIGKTFILNNDREYSITGVLQDIPGNSHLQFNFLASFETLKSTMGNSVLNNPGQIQFLTYLLTAQPLDLQDTHRKIDEFIQKNFPPAISSQMKMRLQPIREIHLYSKLEFEYSTNSDISYIYIYSIIAFFILLIASFNFMNLFTARAAGRAKEVGVRKVLGAQRAQITKQFLGEALVFTIFGFLLSLILIWIVLPQFNIITGKSLQIGLLMSGLVLISFVGIVLLVGLGAGIYPALMLSSFKPVRVMKGVLSAPGRSLSLRKILVVTQFSISIALIIGTVVIKQQHSYIRNKNLGFDKDHIVVLPVRDQAAVSDLESIKSQLRQIPQVTQVTASSGLPGNNVQQILFRLGNEVETENWILNTLFVDYDFLDTLKIELTQGRNFGKEFSTDESNAFIINETAAQKFGWSDPLGKEIIWPKDLEKEGADNIVKKGPVIGIVKDFHFASLHEPIGPAVLQLRLNDPNFISVRIHSENISQTISSLKDRWFRLFPAFPFEYSFLDDDFDRYYKSEEKTSRLVTIFSILAIFIACLGLFGLTVHSVEQRTKEIGIRKVLGSSEAGIFYLLSIDFLKLVLLANIIAWPMAYLAVSSWLKSFAYRTPIGIGPFLSSAAAALFIALMTVSYQSAKAAFSNPIDTMRYE
ncbi:ABC transporter permease [Acidobacteriota bacterium]